MRSYPVVYREEFEAAIFANFIFMIIYIYNTYKYFDRILLKIYILYIFTRI